MKLPSRTYQTPRVFGTGTGCAVGRFYVKAGSVNAVRRALDRAPGGARVMGRFDRETIECSHTMDERSLARHWPVLLSRLAKAGLTVVDRPATGPALPEEEGW